MNNNMTFITGSMIMLAAITIMLGGRGRLAGGRGLAIFARASAPGSLGEPSLLKQRTVIS